MLSDVLRLFDDEEPVLDMKRWMTISEIAKAELPGMPASQQGVDQKSKTEGWAKRPGLSRKRRGSGGGIEYSVDLLPEEARRALVQRDGVFSAEVDIPSGPTSGDTLSSAERMRADAKIYVLNLFEAFRRDKGLSHRDARQLFSTAWKAGTILSPEWVREIVPTISKWSLDNWPKIRREQGDDALGIDQRGRPAKIDSAAEGQAKLRLTALIAKNEFIAGDKLTDYMRTQFAEELGDISTRTVQRARARIEKEDRNVLTHIRDPDGWRSKIEVSGDKMTTVSGLNELWEMDASPADVMLRGGKRHSIYMAIDPWAKRTKVLVTQTPRASAVAALTRKCLLDWGITDGVKTDQGSDFKARAVSRLMHDLKIEHRLCDPYDPKGKPNVERAIKTFQHDLSICPGFIGHSVADRKKIENRKAFSKRLGMDDAELFQVDMDREEFQRWCDEWSDKIYAHRDHGGLKKPAKTPFLKAASWAGQVRRIEDADALAVLIAPVPRNNGICKVTKKGIQIEREFYRCEITQPGADVLVRMDPADLGRVMVFSPDGETFLEIAVCPALAGIEAVKKDAAVKAAQKAFEKAKIDPLRKEMRKIGPRDVMDAIRNQAEKKAGSLVQMPRPSTPYTTPALEAAKAAGSAMVPEVKGYSEDDRKQVSAAVIAMPKAPPAPRVTPKQKMSWAVDLQDRIAGGESIAPEEMARLQSYQETPEYKAWARVIKKQGRAMLAG